MVGPVKSLSVSQTTLNLLRECPRCFWFHTKQGQARPRTAWPSALLKMNQAIESYWRAYSARGLLPPHLQGAVDGVPVTPYLEAWHDRSSGLYLVGRLDACVRSPIGFFVPVDHKWKGSPPEIVDDAYILQLDAYDLLLEKNGYPAAGFGILDYYVPLGETVDTDIRVETATRRVETSGDRALSWMLRARDVLELTEVPDASLDCEYCFWVSQVGHPSSNSAH